MNRRMILAPLAMAAAAATIAVAAYAQPGDHGPGAPPHGMPDMAQMKAMHEQMMRQHIEDLKTILRLRPDQEPALAAFVSAHEPMRMAFHGPGDGPPKAETTPERLDKMAKRDAEEAAEHARRREALAKFYAALSPEQQKVFDALGRMHGGPPGAPGMMRMMTHHGPPGGPMMMHEPPR